MDKPLNPHKITIHLLFVFLKLKRKGGKKTIFFGGNLLMTKSHSKVTIHNNIICKDLQLIEYFLRHSVHLIIKFRPVFVFFDLIFLLSIWS